MMKIINNKLKKMNRTGNRKARFNKEIRNLNLEREMALDLVN